MNILFLTRLFHPHIGGVEKHVYKLSQELLKQNHQITIITTQYESSLDLNEEFDGLTIHRIPKPASLTKLGVFRWIVGHRQLFDESDVIHAHDVFWWCLPLCFSLHKPIYTTFHGWEGKFPPTLKAKAWHRLAEKLSQKNICVGDYLRIWYGTKADWVTYGATDQKSLEPGSLDRILVLGRLSTDVDIDIVLSGLKLIKNHYPHVKITFLGDGDAAWKASQIGNVLGFKPDIQAPLTQAHWVIASSYLSMLEAMAAGRHVFSVYSNPLKKDYLTGHPMAQYLSIAYTPKTLFEFFNGYYPNKAKSQDLISHAQAWAVKQTWLQLTDGYHKIWA